MRTKLWWIAVIVAAVGVPAAATAQAAVGLRTGQRWSQLDTSQEGSSATSWAIAGYFGLGLTHRLALQIETIYGTRGGEDIGFGQDALDPSAAPARLDMRYVEIPILLRAGLPTRRVLPSIFVGPYIGFLVGCQLTPAGEEGRDCDASDVDPRFSTRNTDLGIIVGAALDFMFGRSTLFLDGRYSVGFLSIQSGDDPMDARHAGFELSGGFAVPLGR